MSFASIGNVAIHYAFHSAGERAPVLVFINSLGTDLRIWSQTIAGLGDRFSILLYDKRGHGLSDVGETPYTIEHHVDDLDGLLDHLQIHRSTLCGLSVGGLIAQSLAVRHPDRIERLILCSTGHKIGTADLWETRIRTAQSSGLEPLADATLARWCTATFRTVRATELAGWRNMFVRQPREGYWSTCVALRDADHTDLVGKLRVLTLCIVGDRDEATSPELVKTMSDLIQGARFVVIRDAGHLPCLEQPEALATQIESFIAGE